MFCFKCGTKLPDESVFCFSCGIKLNADASNPENSTSGFTPMTGVASMTIERKKTMYGIALKCKVILDGNLVAELKNGETITISVNNGKHFVHCEAMGMDISETIEFEGKSNKIGLLVSFPSGWNAFSSTPNTRIVLNKIMETSSGVF